MGLKFKTYNAEAAPARAGAALDKLLAANKNAPALLLLSGGSTLKILDSVRPENLSPNLTLTMLDERFTPLEKNSDTKLSGNTLKTIPSQMTREKKSDSLTGFSLDKTVNNFSRLQQTAFYKTAEASHCNFIGTAISPNESKEAFAERWEKRLRDWKDAHQDGKIIATFGMGADGHTAGIFPFADDASLFQKLFFSKSWVTAYSADGKNEFPERVTATLTFFKLIDAGVAYISGEEKKAALEALKNKTKTLESLPALALWDIKNVEVFTDIS